MRITIDSTTKISHINGVPARVWEGTTDSGIKVHCFITRLAIDKYELRCAEFANELQEHAPPSAEVAAFPLRLII